MEVGPPAGCSRRLHHGLGLAERRRVIRADVDEQLRSAGTSGARALGRPTGELDRALAAHPRQRSRLLDRDHQRQASGHVGCRGDGRKAVLGIDEQGGREVAELARNGDLEAAQRSRIGGRACLRQHRAKCLALIDGDGGDAAVRRRQLAQAADRSGTGLIAHGFLRRFVGGSRRGRARGSARGRSPQGAGASASRRRLPLRAPLRRSGRGPARCPRHSRRRARRRSRRC